MPKTIYLDNTILTKDKKFTFLSGDVVAGAQVINVVSTAGFVSLTTSSGQVLCIGELGQEKTEIIKISDVRTSSGTNISGTGATLKTVLNFDHPQDTKVYMIDWDRFEVQHASTSTGTKSTLMTYPENLQPDSLESQYRDTTKTSGFYFVRFNTTIDSTNSDWSDPIPFAGYADNTVHEIKRRALESVGEEIDGVVISNEFLNRCLWEARREFHKSPGKRPFRKSYNVDIGNVSTGMYRVDLPPYVENPYTSENIFGVRIGTERNMSYIGKKEWDFYYVNKPHTTLSTAYAVGDQDLYVSNVRDFNSSGSVTIENDTIEYSAVGVSGGTLRISTAGSTSHAVSSDVWQNASYGLPDKFTVFADVGGSAYIYFNRPLSTSYVNQNIYADYYRTLLEYDSDADELDEPNADMYVSYLAARIKKKRNPALNLAQDDDYRIWLQAKAENLATEYIAEPINLMPDIDHLI